MVLSHHYYCCAAPRFHQANFFSLDSTNPLLASTATPKPLLSTFVVRPSFYTRRHDAHLHSLPRYLPYTADIIYIWISQYATACDHERRFFRLYGHCCRQHILFGHCSEHEPSRSDRHQGFQVLLQDKRHSVVCLRFCRPSDLLLIACSFIKGVAYQQDYTGNGSTSDTDYTDPLADVSSCQRDVPILKALGTNVIRTYAIDPTADHTQCMQLLNDNGIYVISDLSAPSLSINRADPAWNDELYARYTSVVDSLANYTNVLGFFAGNEVSNAPNNTDASAFVKAAVRDTKAYIKSKNYRTIGVGYATNDDASIRIDMADYFNCGSNTANAIDFWGYNIYSWCGDSSYEASGYADRTAEFQNYSVPAFFAEYGCNTPSPRQFTEVDAIYGSNMTSVWSGGIVYMYFQEANDYGLVSVSGNSVSKLQDYSNLSNRLASITPTGVMSASYSPSNSPQACPAIDTSTWNAQASPLPPTPNQEACSCMYNSLQCVVASSVNESDYGDLFGTVCGYSGTVGKDLCAGIEAYGNNATYGAYSMCNTTEQLGFVLNYYYQQEKASNSAACSFGGSATLKKSTSAAGACTALLSEAGAAGTGSVTAAVTGTGAGAAAGGSAATGSSSSSSSKAAGSLMGVHHVDVGFLSVAGCILTAAFSGVAMILL